MSAPIKDDSDFEAALNAAKEANTEAAFALAQVQQALVNLTAIPHHTHYWFHRRDVRIKFRCCAEEVKRLADAYAVTVAELMRVSERIASKDD